jgi:hypothetical protein
VPTTVFVSCRPGLFARTDLVCILDGGVLVASGAPAQVGIIIDWLARFLRAGEPGTQT